MGYWTVSGSRFNSLLSSPPFRQAGGFCVFEAAFYFAYLYALSFSPTFGTALWLPDTVMLCALLLNQPRNWWIYLIGVLPIRLLSPAAHSPAWFLLAAFAIDSIKNVLAATALRRFLSNPLRLASVKDFAVFYSFAALLIPALSASLGAGVNQLLGRPYLHIWQQWFLADSLTHAVVTPAALYWLYVWRRGIKLPSLKRGLEGLGLAAGLICSAQLAFSADMNGKDFPSSYFYAEVPFLLWAVIRFGMAGASGAVGILTFLSVDAALRHHGPFFGKSPADNALILQEFLLFRSVPLYLLAILVQQRDAAEQSMRESEARFCVMADTAPVLIWMAGTDKLCNFFNRGWLEFTGRTMDQELGNGWADGVHPHDRQRCIETYHSAFDARRPFEIEYRLRRRDGEYRWVMDRGVPRYGPDGEFAGYIGSALDLTDRKLAEEAKHDLMHASRLAVLGEFTAMITHELNQPLNAILNNTDAARILLEIKIAPVADVRQILEDIRADNLRASEAIRRIRALVTKREMELHLLDINATVSDVVRLARGDAFRRGVQLHDDCCAPFATVRGDVVHLQQVVLNLIINGMDAMKENPESGRHLFVSTTSHDGSVDVAVRDMGPGIPPEHLPRIFDSFFTTKPDGMGIGLSMCRSIIQMHSGRIWAEKNSDGNGTTFRFALPAVITEAARPATADSQPRASSLA